MLEVILAVLPSLVQGIMTLVKDYEASASADAATLADRLRDLFSQAGEQAAKLADGFGDAHIQAFIQKLKDAAPKK